MVAFKLETESRQSPFPRPRWELPTGPMSGYTHAMTKTPTNLAPMRSSFVGREQELKRLEQLFDSGHRLVTLMGPPGIGKTRLAQRCGANCIEGGTGGFLEVWFCDLTEARSLEGIISSVADVLDVPLLDGKTNEESQAQLDFVFSDRPKTLLILDNFEQVTEYANATLGRWLDSAPEVRFLVTSRERLRIEGEVCLQLSSLELDQAVELFAQRAQLRCRDFDASSEERVIVNQLVTALDKSPLAIELAAARISVLTPAALLERLCDRFALLQRGSHATQTRQSGLRTAIEWSWDLLTDCERDALAQLSTFRGGFSLEAAEAIVELSRHPTAPSILDLVEALLDKSLLRSQVVEARRWFSFYESIREFAASKLAVSNQRVPTEERHAEYFFDRCGIWEAGFAGADSPVSQMSLAREADNLDAIVRRFTEHKPELAVKAALLFERNVASHQSLESRKARLSEIAARADNSIEPVFLARLQASLGEICRQLGLVAEAKALFSSTTQLAQSCKAPAIEGKAILGLGLLARDGGEFEEARTFMSKALALAQEASNPALETSSLKCLANLAGFAGDKTQAAQHFADALVHVERHQITEHKCGILTDLGFLLYSQGELAKAKTLFLQAIELAKETNDQLAHGSALMNLASVEYDWGHLDEAESLNERVVTMYRGVGHRRFEAIALCNLGLLQQERGRLSRAKGNLTAAQFIFREIEETLIGGIVDDHLGRIAHERGLFDEARRLMTNALRRLSSRRGQARTLVSLGIVAVEEGASEEARTNLEHAVEIGREFDEPEEEASALSFLGALEALEDHPTKAKIAFERARKLVVPMGHVGLLKTIDLLEALLDVRCAHNCSNPKKRDTHLATVHQALLEDSAPPSHTRHTEHTLPSTATSFTARIAHRLLRARLAELAPHLVAELPTVPTVEPSESTVELRIHNEALWFQVNEGQRVDLSRRRALRLLLLQLVERCQESSGMAISVYDLIEAGWPSEVVSAESGTNRVYVAIRGLRKLGLDQIIMTGESGYLLNPAIRLIRL